MAKKETKAVLDNFKIQSYVDTLLEANAGTNQRLSHFLNEYQKVLAEDGVKEFMLYEEFGHGLSNFVSGNKAVKKVINEMNTNLATYGKELNTYKLMECICDDAAKCACEDAYTNYLEANDAKSKAILVNAVDVLEQSGDPVAPQLTIVIANPNAQLEPQQISTFDNESKFTEIQRKIEEDKLRQKVEDAKAEIDAYAEKKYAEMKAQEEAERSANVYDNVVNANGICLGESINNIMNSEAKSNKKLVETLEQYKGALNQGLFEERLYESFIKNVTPFNYLKSVDKEIKRLEKVAEEHQVSINVTKILEEMYTTTSYYILPIIEEDACRFIKNPNDVNCNQLKAALVSFTSDPYCQAIMEELEYFNNKPSFLLNDKTMTIKDRAKLIKEHANVSNIYSPVQYIKENECVFNANGQFYVKKGNTLAKLSEEYIPQLSENFISLCLLVNDPRVIMNEDHITLVGNGKIANIYESYIDINGNKESIESVRDLGDMQLKYDFDNNFFIMTSCLAENFDNIANINFGKHIALNEDEGLYVDLFNLNGNIFVNAINESMIQSTFYHNVNAIQCRNLINNHMGINVSYLFEDLIPSQDKMYLKLNETKDEYEASIAKYEATIEKLKKAKEDDISEDSEKKLDAAIEAAQNKVDELKKEYKDWQDDVDKVTNPENNKDEKPEDDEENDNAEDTNNDAENSDDNTEVEKSNEPINAEDVDAVKADLSAPLSGSEAGDLSVSDDEFDKYLEGGSEVPGDSEEMDDTEVNMTHHALAGDGSENNEPNPDELENPMGEENPEETPEEDPFSMVDTNDEESTEEEPVEAPVEEPETSEENPEEPVIEPETSEESIEEEPGTPLEDQGDAMPEGYKIANITFDENLKTGELFRTGSISVMTDMVKADGTLYTDSKTYQFYIDEETHLPVIEAGEIPVALYNAMVTSIQSDEKFGRADADGKERDTEITKESPIEEPEAKIEEPASFDSDEKDFPDYDEVYYDAKEVDNASNELEKDDDEAYFDFKDEPDGSLTISAKDGDSTEDVIPTDEKPKDIKASDLFKGVEDEPDDEDIITPTYKVDDTVIDKPADNIDFEEPSENSEEKDSEEEINFDEDGISDEDIKEMEESLNEEDLNEDFMNEEDLNEDEEGKAPKEFKYNRNAAQLYADVMAGRKEDPYGMIAKTCKADYEEMKREEAYKNAGKKEPDKDPEKFNEGAKKLILEFNKKAQEIKGRSDWSSLYKEFKKDCAKDIFRLWLNCGRPDAGNYVQWVNDGRNLQESITEDNAPAQQPQQGQQPQQLQQLLAQPQQLQQLLAQPQQLQQPAQQPQQLQQGQQQLQQGQQQLQQGQQPAQQQPQQKNESVEVKEKLTLNEARAAFVKLKAEYTSRDGLSFNFEGASQPSKKEADSVNEGWEEAAGKIATEVGTKILKDVGPKIADMVAKKAGEIITNKVDNALNGKNNLQQLQQAQQLLAQPQQLQQLLAQPQQLQQPAQQQTSESANSINEEDDAKDNNGVSTGINAAGSALGVGTLTDDDALALIKELFTNPEYRQLIMDTIVQTAESIPQFTAIVKLTKAIIKLAKDGKPGMDPKEMLKDMTTKPSDQAKGMLNNMKMTLEILKKVFIKEPKQLLNAAKIIAGLTGDSAAAGGEVATGGIATIVLAPIQAGSTKMMVTAAINLAAAFAKAFLQYVKENPSKNDQNQQLQLPQQNQQLQQPQLLAQPQQLQQPQQNQSNESVKIDAIDKLYEYAIENAGNAVEITQVQSAKNESVKFFGIIDLLRQKEPMAVYEVNDKVFYSNYDDLIYSLNESSITPEDLESFDEDDLDYVNAALLEDGYQLIDSLLLERAKIRKPGLTSNGDIKQSQKMADILNGTKDRREFEKKVERMSSLAGVENPLMPQQLAQLESVEANIEDANDLSESLVDKENVEVIYEPMDWVIIKEIDMKALVTNVYNDGDGNIKMLTVVASNGVCYDVDPDEIEPDPMYLVNLPGRTINSTLLGVPRLATFDINPKTKLTDRVNNDDPALEEKYKNFNDND